MKVLFLTGIGVSFGELYAATHAARQLKSAGHSVEFACVCDEPALTDCIEQAGFKVIQQLGLPTMLSVLTGKSVVAPENFTENLQHLANGTHDIIYLIDYQHFFMRPEAVPPFSTYYVMLQDAIAGSPKRIWTNDHSLWALNPHPSPEFGQRVIAPPESVEHLFLPAPPHFNRYEGCRKNHSPVFYYQDLLKNTPKEKGETGKLNLLLSVSHFAIPIADLAPLTAVDTILKHTLNGLAKLDKQINLSVTGITPEQMQTLTLPANVSLNESSAMNVSGFDDYDKQLMEYDGILLYNAISVTITRALFMQIPVILLTQGPEQAQKDGTAPYNVYPTYIPTVDILYAENPFFNHCKRCELTDDSAIAKAMQSTLTGASLPITKDLKKYFQDLPSLEDFC